MNDSRLQQACKELLRRRAQERSAPNISLEQVRELAESRSIRDDQLALLDEVLSNPVTSSEFYYLREIAQGGAPARPSWLPGWTAAAALLMVGVGLAFLLVSLRGPKLEPLPTGAAEVALVSPGANQGFAPGSRFVWHSVAGATDYVLQLLNAEGEVVWNQTSTDTTLILPGSAPIIEGGTYSWLIRANLRDGTTANSSAQTIIATGRI